MSKYVYLSVPVTQGKARQVYLYSTIQQQGDSKSFTETFKQKKKKHDLKFKQKKEIRTIDKIRTI